MISRYYLLAIVPPNPSSPHRIVYVWDEKCACGHVDPRGCGVCRFGHLSLGETLCENPLVVEKVICPTVPTVVGRGEELSDSMCPFISVTGEGWLFEEDRT